MFEKFKDASGVIFDCDGCLLDSMKAWRQVEFGLIEMTGVDWTQEMLESMRAAPMREACRIFHEDYGVMESIEAVGEYMKKTMLDYYSNPDFRPGAREFVEQLHAQGTPCCIVSSTPARFLVPTMEALGIRNKFIEIFSSEETGISKSDPAIYKMALEKMGAQADTAWGFDDSLYAIKVMASVGIHAIGTYEDDVAGTFEQLDEAGDFAIKSFEELLS